MYRNRPIKPAPKFAPIVFDLSELTLDVPLVHPPTRTPPVAPNSHPNSNSNAQGLTVGPQTARARRLKSQSEGPKVRMSRGCVVTVSPILAEAVKRMSFSLSGTVVAALEAFLSAIPEPQPDEFLIQSAVHRGSVPTHTVPISFSFPKLPKGSPMYLDLRYRLEAYANKRNLFTATVIRRALYEWVKVEELELLTAEARLQALVDGWGDQPKKGKSKRPPKPQPDNPTDAQRALIRSNRGQGRRTYPKANAPKRLPYGLKPKTDTAPTPTAPLADLPPIHIPGLDD